MKLFRLKPVPNIELAHLTRPDSPNTYFVCPVGFSTSTPDQIAPEFALPAASLLKAWKTVTDAQPRIEELAVDSMDNNQITHVQRTPLLGYPDVITTHVIALTEGRSSLAIYSRSQYGHSDFGVNGKRVRHWLALLERVLD